jgi:hypothetical protein
MERHWKHARLSGFRMGFWNLGLLNGKEECLTLKHNSSLHTFIHESVSQYNFCVRYMPFQQSPASLSMRKPGFNPRTIHMQIVVDIVALERLFSELLCVPVSVSVPVSVPVPVPVPVSVPVSVSVSVSLSFNLCSILILPSPTLIFQLNNTALWLLYTHFLPTRLSRWLQIAGQIRNPNRYSVSMTATAVCPWWRRASHPCRKNSSSKHWVYGPIDSHLPSSAQ